MSSTTSHPSCEHHHLAAARHVAAAYHHMKAIEEHDKGNHEGGEKLATTAQTEGMDAHQHAKTAVSHCH